MGWLRREPVPVEASAVRRLAYVRTWVCEGPGCNVHTLPDQPRRAAALTLRRREDAPEGPSNYAPGKQPHELTWNGLAEERGWQTDPVRCPACQAGLSVAAYKRARRK